MIFLKFKTLVLGVVFSLLMVSPTFASASSHTNVSSDQEPFSVSYGAGGGMVPFLLNAQIKMYITVTYPGKIISYEEMYGNIPAGDTLPWSYTWNPQYIKYYKDGTYRTTHYLTTNVPYIAPEQDRTFDKSNKPNSDLADSSTYKAVGSAIYQSLSTIPSVYVADTTEGVVD